MKKTLAILGILALLGGCLAACGKAKPEALLAGKWNAAAASLEFQAFEFIPSAEDPAKGTVNLGMISNLFGGTYEIIRGQGKNAQDTLKITYSLWMISTTRSYQFTVDETTLTMTEEGKSLTTTYTRVQQAQATTA